MSCAEIEKIIIRQIRGSQLSAYAHFGAAERMSRLHLWFGVPIAFISVLLGSVLFADLHDSVPDILKWFGAVISLVGAFLASLQTFFNPEEGVAKHREIANGYLSVNRKYEILLARLLDAVNSVEEIADYLESINNQYDSINSQAENYPTSDKDWARAKNKIKGIDQSRVLNASKDVASDV